MDLKEVVQRLEKFAPTNLAGNWDNVGLLIQPTESKDISRIVLTNDLTEPVMDEVIQSGSNMIISYHPPIFKPFKRLTEKSWKERITLRCIENRIALYSPHTSWDAIKGGINEWLLVPFGPGVSEVCEKQDIAGSESFTLNIPGADSQTVASRGEVEAQLCTLPVDVRPRVRITRHEPHPLPGVGAGRMLTLESPISVEEAVRRIKDHLKLTHVRLALANGCGPSTLVGRVGVCAGSGGSVLAGAKADLILTGEMSHHEVLDFFHRGVSVVLTDHSNTERGFLSFIRSELVSLLDNRVEILVSTVDKDPLVVV